MLRSGVNQIETAHRYQWPHRSPGSPLRFENHYCLFQSYILFWLSNFTVGLSFISTRAASLPPTKQVLTLEVNGVSLVKQQLYALAAGLDGNHTVRQCTLRAVSGLGGNSGNLRTMTKALAGSAVVVLSLVECDVMPGDDTEAVLSLLRAHQRKRDEASELITAKLKMGGMPLLSQELKAHLVFSFFCEHCHSSIKQGTFCQRKQNQDDKSVQ